MVLEAGKSKIKVLVDLVPSENPSWLADAHLLTGGETQLSGVSSFSYKGTNPTMGAPPSCSQPNIITFPKPHLLIPSPWGLGLQHMSGGT